MKSIPGTEYIVSYTVNGYRYFRVQKRCNGNSRFYGQGRTLIEALMIRDYGIANDWKPFPTYNSKTQEPYIHVNRKSYSIVKQINGKLEYFGTFDKLEDAIKERDLLIACDWDWERLCECVDEEGVL